jgi:hypothetical protein
MIEERSLMLVAESWDEDEGYVQAVLLTDYDGPGFTIVICADAKQLGKARVKVDTQERGALSAPVGQLFVRNGHAAISYLTGWNVIALLQIPLADADNVPDGDYGFSWSLECSIDGKQWNKVYEADQQRSWLNEWLPANNQITGFLSQQIDDLRVGLIPEQ